MSPTGAARNPRSSKTTMSASSKLADRVRYAARRAGAQVSVSGGYTTLPEDADPIGEPLPRLWVQVREGDPDRIRAYLSERFNVGAIDTTRWGRPLFEVWDIHSSYAAVVESEQRHTHEHNLRFAAHIAERDGCDCRWEMILTPLDAGMCNVWLLHADTTCPALGASPCHIPPIGA